MGTIEKGIKRARNQRANSELKEFVRHSVDLERRLDAEAKDLSRVKEEQQNEHLKPRKKRQDRQPTIVALRRVRF